MLGETLRIELAPFSVKVLTVVTGGVTTSFLANSTVPDLPPQSRYLAVTKEFKALAKGEDGLDRTPSDKFADDVVRDVLSGCSGKTWRGAKATLTRYATPVLPMWAMACTPLSGLSQFVKLTEPIQGWNRAKRFRVSRNETMRAVKIFV